MTLDVKILRERIEFLKARIKDERDDEIRAALYDEMYLKLDELYSVYRALEAQHEND